MWLNFVFLAIFLVIGLVYFDKFTSNTNENLNSLKYNLTNLCNCDCSSITKKTTINDQSKTTTTTTTTTDTTTITTIITNTTTTRGTTTISLIPNNEYQVNN